MPHQRTAHTQPAAEIPGATPVVGPDKRLLSLDQVPCPSGIRQQLRQLAAWRNQGDLLEEWCLPSRHGPVVLFTGASGTGKTMAAQALATSAGIPLYRVDMGLIVSKYIGETPKNINELFRHARRTDAILLFDEADALFGKRGETDEARDRDANVDVGQLLSQMEEYPGICLLTANTAEQIDPEVLRRVNLTIHFPPSR